MRRDCETILQQAIAAVEPYQAIHQNVHCTPQGELSMTGTRQVYNLYNYDTIQIVAFGKASSGMATALVQVLQTALHPDRQQQQQQQKSPSIQGLVIVKDQHATPDEVATLVHHNIAVYEAAHPVPDARSVAASQQLLQLLQDDKNDNKSHEEETHTSKLVIVCISGGGSALFCTPHDNLSLQNLQDTNQALLQSGMSIQEMNVIRKKLEVGKGGGLAEAVFQRNEMSISGKHSPLNHKNHALVSLILSDVLGDPLDLIASGPTVPDSSTWQDAWKLVQQNNLHADGKHALPKAVLQHLQEGLEREQQNDMTTTTTAAASSSFRKATTTCLVGNNALAVQQAARTAAKLGYEPRVLGTRFQGEARDFAEFLVAMAEHVQQPAFDEYGLVAAIDEHGNAENNKPVALIAGGETTVTIPTDCSGKGGRNQELALTAAVAMTSKRHASGLEPLRNVVIASAGTDGTDGPTDAAGAIVDGGTLMRLQQEGEASVGEAAIEALRNHDAYHFLDQTDQNGRSPLIRTGPTGTNVADVMIALIDRKQ